MATGTDISPFAHSFVVKSGKTHRTEQDGDIPTFRFTV